MVNEQLRQGLLAMRAEDQTVRQELIDSGELGGSYVPRMEDVHRKNAARLRDLIELYGWPAEPIAGQDGAEAAWLIAQHAVGEPDFQRRVLALLRASLRIGCRPGTRPTWRTVSQCTKVGHSVMVRNGCKIQRTDAIDHGRWPTQTT
jgi:hypothetical protein